MVRNVGTDFQTLPKNILADSFFVKEGFFKKESVMKLIDDHKVSRVDNHVRLWMLLGIMVPNLY